MQAERDRHEAAADRQHTPDESNLPAASSVLLNDEVLQAVGDAGRHTVEGPRFSAGFVITTGREIIDPLQIKSNQINRPWLSEMIDQ